MIARIASLAVLALLFAAVAGSFDAVTLGLGFLLGALALFLVRRLLGRDSFRAFRPATALYLLGLFLWELLLSSLRVARDVLRLRMSFRPGIVAIPLDVDRDVEITLLANLITLTPGTMSLDVSDDRSTLYIHQMSVTDIASARESIKSGFEKTIIRALK